MLIGISVGEIKLVYEEADLRRATKKIKFSINVQYWMFEIFSYEAFMLYQKNNQQDLKNLPWEKFKKFFILKKQQKPTKVNIKSGSIESRFEQLLLDMNKRMEHINKELQAIKQNIK